MTDAGSDIYAAATLGDDAGVRQCLAVDPALATAKGGPRGWDALTYLCFSPGLRDRERAEGFVRAAAALLDAGASANTGYWESEHQPRAVWESAIYGAAGVAHYPELTRLLLERGADPNDEETPYHAPEGNDNAALKVLVESGKLTADSLATMLLRKADWHDLEGVRYLLERGADPNRMTRWGHTGLHQAVRRDNALTIIETMLDYGAEPAIPNQQDGRTAVAMAARRGRGDVLALLERRNKKVELVGLDGLAAACATGTEPRDVGKLYAEGGTLLAEFAGNGNTVGVGRLLDLGIDVEARYEEGDGYFGIAKRSTALHVAAWRGRHETVLFLLERGARAGALDGEGRTPLELAVRARTSSYWAERCLPDTEEALRRASLK